MAKRIAVLASGSGTNLQALIDAQKNGEILSGEIVLVLSNKENAYALTRAEQNGIDTAVIPSVGDREAFTKKVVDYLVQQEIDLVVLAGFMIILGQQFTKTFRGRILNVHPALIPSFCGDGFYGLKVHEKALEYGVKLTGATVHFVNEVTDGGEIVLQKAVAVREDDTPETLQRRVMEEAEWQILPQAVSLFCQDRLVIEGRKVKILDK
ncbi:MAG: phosphoribosylglycinamide formyltransferase [Clostridia bacterium]|nr:phosphoribosylglycinamide formyltransferase [Clostridia bacterium]